jgi:2-polyprenyl-3-methyl-5-hydroxy-6-metoxy-1,4-benzoquinol methylase
MRRALAIFAVALAGFAAEPADQQIFQEFLGWYKSYTGSFAPPEVAKVYEASLKDTGVAPPEAQRRIGVLQRLVSTMPREFAALHFDRIYGMPDPPFKAAASQFLVRMVDGLKPGKALDVAMGQGRNSHFLATQGWDVTGYDISEGGLAQARKLADKAGLKIRTVTASHQEFDYGKGQWDLIVEAFAFTNFADEAYRKRVVESLKPGGLLVIEGFGDPGRRDLKSPLLEGFQDLRIVSYESRDEIADWGLHKMRLERLAAEKH